MHIFKNKNELFESVRSAVNNEIVTKDELLTCTNELSRVSANSKTTSTQAQDNSSFKKNSVITNILYAFGGIVTLTGVLVLLFQSWDSFTDSTKILLTVGVALILYIFAMYTSKSEEHSVLSQVLFTVAAAVAPIGWYTVLSIYMLSFGSAAVTAAIVSGTCAIIFGYATWYSRKPILHLFVTAFVSWCYFSLISEVVRGSGLDLETISSISTYSVMLISIAVFMYALFLSSNSINKTVCAILVFYSYAQFLIAGLLQVGGIWNFLYAFILVGAVYLAIHIRSTGALVVTALAVVGYLIKISAKYFADSLGWAVLLIFVGFLIIGIGYGTYRINKKYIVLQD